jgi:hypothetical protein
LDVWSCANGGFFNSATKTFFHSTRTTRSHSDLLIYANKKLINGGDTCMRAGLSSAYLPLSLPHCIENPIHVFPGMKLRGLVPNSYIDVSVSDLYIPRIGLPVWRQQNWQNGNI